MLYILNCLHHLRAVRRWSDSHGAQMHLSARNWSLTLTRGQQVQRLIPRFVTQRDGQICYVRVFDEAGGFAGWHPPHQEGWPLARDKVSFKRHASAMGLRVPAGWNSAQPLANDFLIKKRQGSFGTDIEGPFNARAGDRVRALAEGAYYEQFVSGRSAKAWCWNGQVAALELIAPPCLTGDGLRSLQALAAPRGNVGRALPLERAAAVLAWQGLTVESVPEAGQEVFLDFRYTTSFDMPVFENRNVWAAQDEPVRHQFARAAALLATCLPAQLAGRSLFTLDAVLDVRNRAWFLEMNSHPMIHPDIYEPMLDSLMGG